MNGEISAGRRQLKLLRREWAGDARGVGLDGMCALANGATLAFASGEADASVLQLRLLHARNSLLLSTQ